MEHTNPSAPVQREERAIRVILVVFGIIIIVLLGLLVRDYQIVNHMRLPRVHTPLTINNLDVVQPWMTFDYLNRLFALPQNALKTSLALSDPRYPHMRIGTALLQKTKDAIRSYLTNK